MSDSVASSVKVVGTAVTSRAYAADVFLGSAKLHEVLIYCRKQRGRLYSAATDVLLRERFDSGSVLGISTDTIA
jgi:hypothetical protein